MPITRRPPHRPVWALLMHTVPTLDHDVADPTRSARSVGSIVHLAPLAQCPAQAPAVGSPWPSAQRAPASLHALRRQSPGLVRTLRQDYAAARLPSHVHPGLIPHRFLRASRRLRGRHWGLSVLARGVSMHAWGLRLRRVPAHSHVFAHRVLVLPASRTPSAPWIGDFGAPYPAYIYPCPTLPVRPHDRPRMARSQS